MKQGERVNLSFNMVCGLCHNCVAGKTAFCLTVNPPYGGTPREAASRMPAASATGTAVDGAVDQPAQQRREVAVVRGAGARR